MNLWVNMLLEWSKPSAESRIERILWIDQSGTDVVTIEIPDKTSLPTWQKSQELETEIASFKARILEVDPYATLLRPENTISQKCREFRERAWEVIAPLVETELIFDPNSRGSLIKATVERTGRTKATIYSYLRRYWQAGQTKNALLPQFNKRGGKGKERLSSGCKRGRPSSLSKAIEMPLGVNVDAKIRERFRRGIKLFYENQQGRNLKEAFQLTIEKFFHQGYQLESGVLVPVLPPASELPTFAQFRYWYEKERDLSQSQVARVGQRRFNLSHRAVLGDSTGMAFGPGSLYQIDATIGDIYLVSSLDRTRIIGRPIIYVIIDTFSRLITGFSVSLEGPSWLGAMLALENTTSDKIAFCQEYGIQIDQADWPSHHLPEAILADRGELEGYNADNLVNALNIRVSNTPPYRADWKGIIERNFRTLDERMIHWIPGAIHRARERGDKDYRLDAVLDLHQFRQLMIWCVLDYNKNHLLDWYRMDEFMIAEHIAPYPMELWNWGVRYRSGHLRAMASEIVRLNLLPTASATVTHRGIRCFGLLYSCDLARREQWFVKAREKGNWRISIAYDVRFLDTIYLRLNDKKQLEPCQLIEADKTFRGLDWHETIDYFEHQKQAKEASRTRLTQTKANFHAQVEQIVSEAQDMTEKAFSSQSNHSRLKGIRKNRQLEREHERQTQAWKLGAEEIPSGPEQTISHLSVSNDLDESEYIGPPSPIDKLRQLREKNWKND